MKKLEEYKVETERYLVSLTIYEDPVRGDFIAEFESFPRGIFPPKDFGDALAVDRQELLSPEYHSNKDRLIERCKEVIDANFGVIERLELIYSVKDLGGAGA